MADDWNDEEHEAFSKRWTCKWLDGCHIDVDGKCTAHSSHADRKYKVIRLGEMDSDYEAWARPVLKDMTFNVITVKHQEFTRAWKKSSTYKACYRVIEETIFRQERLKITACMCLGLGSFTGVHHKKDGPAWRDRSLSQLVAFECWVDQLSIHSLGTESVPDK